VSETESYYRYKDKADSAFLSDL